MLQSIKWLVLNGMHESPARKNRNHNAATPAPPCGNFQPSITPPAFYWYTVQKYHYNSWLCWVHCRRQQFNCLILMLFVGWTETQQLMCPNFKVRSPFYNFQSFFTCFYRLKFISINYMYFLYNSKMYIYAYYIYVMYIILIYVYIYIIFIMYIIIYILYLQCIFRNYS